MRVRNIVKKDAYYDSVTLMLVSREIKKEQGIIDAAIMMGTEENLKILKSAGLFQTSTEAGPNDLIIAIKGDEKKIDEILSRIDSYFEKTRKSKSTILPEGIQEALKILPDANLALISV
ncbi:MAG TPA: fatty-acid metabolism regulator protein, partial [Candidatus Atribacteria bacterium]|nr:fatty-acid metabolism regulator protein [Candidatus Atribacteria bacterium]